MADANGNRDVAVGITGTAQVIRGGASATGSGGWFAFRDIQLEAAQYAAEEYSQPPAACPNDGEPLRKAPNGALFCPFDGWPNE